jgi:hypothetical protein
MRKCKSAPVQVDDFKVRLAGVTGTKFGIKTFITMPKVNPR